MMPDDREQRLTQLLLRLATDHPEWEDEIGEVIKQGFDPRELTLRQPTIEPVKKIVIDEEGGPGKQELSNQLRGLGRFLMMAAMRSPRQQMFVVSTVIRLLLKHMDTLAGNDPNMKSLKRRIMMSLRNQVFSRM
jgi:hypothetical protein